MEPIDFFSRSHGDSSVQEFIDATPEELRGQTIMEITENSVIDDFPHMRHVLDRLRDQGFRIAIDDAGAGYSGLQTMVEIEPDFIKLDMSLTRHLDASVVKQKLVGTLRDFCRQADIALVAEGIETLAQLDALLALGITYGQGFLFAHPGSPYPCLLYTSDAADDLLCVDLGGRRIIKKKNKKKKTIKLQFHNKINNKKYTNTK